MTALESLLREFGEAMLQKFIARHDRAIRRWGRSVVDDDFPWNDLDHESIIAHFWEEIEEWKHDQDGLESVDIANMAFLDWVYHRRGEIALFGGNP